MKNTIITAACGIICASATFAGTLNLTPANPQPSGLTEGLAVSYAYPADVKSLSQAERIAKGAKPGKPLAGMDYIDTKDGDKTLTSTKAHHVVADISGYVRFDAAGTYTIDFLSNDGLQVKIGGQEVAFFDGRHPCEESDPATVKVPSAGWYELSALYFQRTGSACLHMRAGMGEPDWMENASFGH
jgi:hypothetical protein